MRPWAALALVALISAVPLQKRDGSSVFLGYRIVDSNEATAINNNGQKLVASLGTSGKQLGAGTYISPGFQEFYQGDDPLYAAYWDCAITVDPAAWATVNLAWVPKSVSVDDACLPLWNRPNDANRVKYIQSLDPSWTPDNTVLLSDIQSFAPLTQMLIPTPFITGMAFNAQCAKRGTDANTALAAFGSADWSFGGRVRNMPSS